MSKKQLIFHIISGVLILAVLGLQIYTITELNDLKSSVSNLNREDDSRRSRNTDTAADNDIPPATTGQEHNQGQPQDGDGQHHTQQPQHTQGGDGTEVTNENISATFTSADSWVENDRTLTRISAVIKNTSDIPISIWTVTLTVPEGAEIRDGQNAEFSITGTTLTITSTVDRTLNAGDTYNDVGFIIISDDVFTP
jgi:hypothetical protein